MAANDSIIARPSVMVPQKLAVDRREVPVDRDRNRAVEPKQRARVELAALVVEAQRRTVRITRSHRPKSIANRTQPNQNRKNPNRLNTSQVVRKKTPNRVKQMINRRNHPRKAPNRAKSQAKNPKAKQTQAVAHLNLDLEVDRLVDLVRNRLVVQDLDLGLDRSLDLNLDPIHDRPVVIRLTAITVDLKSRHQTIRTIDFPKSIHLVIVAVWAQPATIT